ncbi:MAG: hypothetical protein AcusKO_07140 [Acuticoccus sp.]
MFRDAGLDHSRPNGFAIAIALTIGVYVAVALARSAGRESSFAASIYAAARSLHLTSGASQSHQQGLAFNQRRPAPSALRGRYGQGPSPSKVKLPVDR